MKKGINIYIANLGAYNEGRLKGEWVSLPISENELQEVLLRIGIDGVHYEEYAIHDYDITNGLNISISEYESIDTLNEIAENIESLDEYELKQLIACYNVIGGDILDALNSRTFENYTYIECDSSSHEDIGYALIDLDGGVENLADDTLERHFDMERFAHDLSFDFDDIIEDFEDEDKEEMGDWSEAEFAEWYIEGLGSISELGKDTLQRYFDYESYGRDCVLGGFVTYDEETKLLVIE